MISVVTDWLGEVEAKQSSSSAVPLDPPAPANPPAGPVELDPATVDVDNLVTDSAKYWYLPGRWKPLGRITSWKASFSAACHTHGSGCRRIMSQNQAAAWHVDPHRELKKWLVLALSDTRAATADGHMGLPKPLGV